MQRHLYPSTNSGMPRGRVQSYKDVEVWSRTLIECLEVKSQSNCQVLCTRFTRFLKRTKTTKYVIRRIKTYYIDSDTWLVKHSRNLVKPNTYLKRDHILTQRGGENRSKT